MKGIAHNCYNKALFGTQTFEFYTLFMFHKILFFFFFFNIFQLHKNVTPIPSVRLEYGSGSELASSCSRPRKWGKKERSIYLEDEEETQTGSDCRESSGWSLTGEEAFIDCNHIHKKLLGPQGYFWRRVWHLTPVFLPGEFHAQRRLGVGAVGYCPWGHKELDTTKQLTHTHGC